MRGCERRVIMLKGTSSEIFDEAYFLLRRDFKNAENDTKIVDEAHRIVALNTTKRRRKKTVKRELIFFLSGVLLGAVTAIIFAIFF